MLAVVVLDRDGVQAEPRRQQNLTVVLELLAELQTRAPGAVQADLKRLHTHIRLAQGALLTFVAPLQAVQQAMVMVVGQEGMARIGWAWLRRKALGWDMEQLLAGMPEGWRAAARVLLHTWERATRASSAVENWHSLLRPHLAVHRVLSSGLLALLAVWHNHRVSRAVHIRAKVHCS